MKESQSGDTYFMTRALNLARKAWGCTHPNPMVGAVIVHSGVIIAEGWHRRAGSAHAEVEALKEVKGKLPEAATLYLTLEPCSTVGRTGACTDAIIASGIRRVMVGAEDPNPAHTGRGIEILRQAGIEVTTGVMADECADLNLIFNHWIVQKAPFFGAKMALTLDGKFAASSGHSKWVSSEVARADVMRWRRYFPAIAVSANTVIADNPRLTSRMGEVIFCPRRLILDRDLKTIEFAETLAVYSDDYASNTIVVCLKTAEPARKEQAKSRGLEIWELNAVGDQVDWESLRQRCAEEAVYGVYFEPGPRLATAILESAKTDYLFVYKSSKFMADSAAPGIGTLRQTKTMQEAIELKRVHHQIFQDDVLIRGFLK